MWSARLKVLNLTAYVEALFLSRSHLQVPGIRVCTYLLGSNNSACYSLPSVCPQLTSMPHTKYTHPIPTSPQVSTHSITALNPKSHQLQSHDLNHLNPSIGDTLGMIHPGAKFLSISDLGNQKTNFLISKHSGRTGIWYQWRTVPTPKGVGEWKLGRVTRVTVSYRAREELGSWYSILTS